ncbi:unnamed protein product, partial [Adineta ricciae]
MTDILQTTITHNSSSSSILTQDFAKIIKRYKKHCSYITRLLEETDRSYREIYDKNVLTSDKFSDIKISTTEREFIELLSSKPLALIVCSQTYNGKAHFVNEFLNEILLPESPVIGKDDVVRMVRIKHHQTTGATLNISGSFELLDTDGAQRSVSWLTVPRDLLIVTDEHDQAETASLEIRKPLNLLGNNLQILITPTNQKMNVPDIYSQITENVVPIFIYIIDQGQLLDHDIE